MRHIIYNVSFNDALCIGRFFINCTLLKVSFWWIFGKHKLLYLMKNKLIIKQINHYNNFTVFQLYNNDNCA